MPVAGAGPARSGTGRRGSVDTMIVRLSAWALTAARSRRRETPTRPDHPGSSPQRSPAAWTRAGLAASSESARIDSLSGVVGLVRGEGSRPFASARRATRQQLRDRSAHSGGERSEHDGLSCWRAMIRAARARKPPRNAPRSAIRSGPGFVASYRRRPPLGGGVRRVEPSDRESCCAAVEDIRVALGQRLAHGRLIGPAAPFAPARRMRRKSADS